MPTYRSGINKRGRERSALRREFYRRAFSEARSEPWNVVRAEIPCTWAFSESAEMERIR